MADGINFTAGAKRTSFFEKKENQEQYQEIFNHLIENEEWLDDGDEGQNGKNGEISDKEILNFISHIDGIGENESDGVITDEEIMAWAEKNGNQIHKNILENEDAFAQFKNFLGAVVDNVIGAKEDIKEAGTNAARLHDAMKGLGTDEDVLKEIIEGASEEELKEIVKQYDKKYAKEDGKEGLIERIASETSGKLEKSLIEKVVNSLVSDPTDKDASEILADGLYQAMDGWGTNENILKAIINNADEAQLKDIAAKYDEQYAKEDGKKGLIERIASETSGELEKTLVSKVTTALSSATDDENTTSALVDSLYQAMEGWGTNENILSSVIDNADEAQLREIVLKYDEQYGKDGGKSTLIQRIQDETSGKYETALIEKVVGSLLANCEEDADSATTLAKELNTAMDRLGTDSKMLKAILLHESMTEEKYQALIDAYRDLTGNELYETVRKEGDRDILDNLQDRFKYNKA